MIECLWSRYFLPFKKQKKRKTKHPDATVYDGLYQCFPLAPFHDWLVLGVPSFWNTLSSLGYSWFQNSSILFSLSNWFKWCPYQALSTSSPLRATVLGLLYINQLCNQKQVIDPLWILVSWSVIWRGSLVLSKEIIYEVLKNMWGALEYETLVEYHTF